METLQINKANALTAYEKASKKEKSLLENLFGVHVFIKDIRDRIQIFDDVLELNGWDKEAFMDSLEGLAQDEAAYRQIKEIVKAYNQGWTPNWLDTDEYKYYSWFEAKKAGSGVGFSYNVYFYVHSASCVGSRLVYKESDLAVDAGKKFEHIYNEFLKP